MPRQALHASGLAFSIAASLILTAHAPQVVAQQASDANARFQALYDAAKYDAAASYAQSVLAQQRTPNTRATWMHNLAMAYDGAGRYKDAEPVYWQSLALLEQALGKEHANVALSLSNLANTLSNLGKYAEAEQAYRRSIAIRQKIGGPDNPELIANLIGLAGVYYAQGKYADVEPLYVRSLAIVRKVMGQDNEVLAAILSNLGALYQAQGRYEQAESNYLQALRMREKLRGKEHPDVAQVLDNLAGLDTQRGHYVDAVRRYQRALGIQQAAFGNSHPDVGMTLHNLAALYMSQGRLADGERLANEALDIWRKFGADKPERLATSLSNLADIKRRRGDFADSEAIEREALRVQTRAFGDDYAANAELIANIAIAAAGQKRFDESDKLQSEAIARLEKAYGPNHPKLVTAINFLVAARLVGDRLAGCEALAGRSVAIAEANATDYESLFHSYNLRARVFWEEGKRDAALADLQRAMDLADRQRTATAGLEFEQSTALGNLAHVYARGAVWQAKCGRGGEALECAERGKARGLLTQMELSGTDLLAGISAAEAGKLRDREAKARVRLASLQSYYRSVDQGTQSPGQPQRAELQRVAKEIVQAQADYMEACRDIRNASINYRLAVGKNRKSVALVDLQRSLTAVEGLLLEYVSDEEETSLIIVPPSGEPKAVALTVNKDLAGVLGIEPGDLTEEKLGRVLAWNDRPIAKAFTAKPPTGKLLERLEGLWKLLVPEAERSLITSGSLKHLVIVPDGALDKISFETLVVERRSAPQYLLDVSPPISYAPSATVFDNLSHRQPAALATDRQPVLTVVDPLYGAAASSDVTDAAAQLTSRSRYAVAGGRLQPLPSTRKESVWLADNFKQQGIAVARLDRGLATEANVRANIAGRQIVHLACHGIADEELGNTFGALALTPGKHASASAADDGYLTLGEIYELNLKNCELAILSACDTNYGPDQKGEGTWAVSRGFLVAGCRHVVASNWLVDDEAAASLISYFSGGVAKGEKALQVNYAESLQAAKRWVREQDKWQSPYYWGTFVLVGAN